MKRNYRNLKIVIVGLGKTGLSCLYFFLAQGVVPNIIDTRLYPPLKTQLPRYIKYCFGRLNDSWILQANLIVVSPGVRLDSPVFIEAIRLGIEIVGDIELFVREINSPIIAITGSNGKSTVTQLVGNMARCAGLHVGVAGNIGVPVLTLLNKRCQLYILEISSFQLDVTYSLRATSATILNISEDHMDRYPGGFIEYSCSKRKIYRNAITCIVNALDPLTYPLSHDYGCIVSFGIYSDSADYRLERYRGRDWIVVYNKYVLCCSTLTINNYINYVNILSALALSDSVNIPRISALKAIQCFFGLSHRFQLVCKNRDIHWINDSKSTNVRSAKSAIDNTLIKLSGNLHLLLGGDRKLADFYELEYLIKQYEIHLYCFGKDGIFLTKLGFNNVFFTTYMQDAVYIISRRVKNKDVVLLSPACSSLDQFSSFEERGNLFTYLVEKLR